MTHPVPAGGAVQNTWIRVLLLGVLSVTATGQLLMNWVSSSSMIWGSIKRRMGKDKDVHGQCLSCVFCQFVFSVSRILLILSA